MSGGTVLADNHPIVSTETLPRWNRLQAGLLRPSRGHTYSHPTTMDKRLRSYTEKNNRKKKTKGDLGSPYNPLYAVQKKVPNCFEMSTLKKYFHKVLLNELTNELQQCL